MPLLYVNDIDVADLGVTVGQSIDGWRDGPDIRLPAAPLLGRIGRLGLTDAPAANARVFSVDAVQIGSTVADLLSKLDQLKRLVYDGVVRIRTGEASDREYLGVAGLTVGPMGDWLNQVAHTLRFRFDCDDATARALIPTVVPFSASATAIPLGTAPSAPVIRIGDSVTNPVITYKDHRGQTQRTMGFTITIAAGGWLEIDCELKTIVDQDGAQQAAALTSGDFIELNPYDGGGIAGPWPTLGVSGGSLAQAEYRKRWL